MPLAAIRAGGKRALASALAEIEAQPDAPQTADLLDQAFAAPQGFALGLTGPPGVGKSTLVDALIRAWRTSQPTNQPTVAVIAVDPSSARSGGALLGDRTRLTTDPGDAGVFVRSMAARDRLGGVAEMTLPATVLMRALFDRVIVETVGVGQSETEIAGTADMVAVCAQPGAGDALQFMKAGIIEAPDLVIVTKTDMGAIARRTMSDLKGALSLGAHGVRTPVLGVAATTGEGVAEALQEICTIADRMAPGFADARLGQIRSWAERRISAEFGSEGLRHAWAQPVDNFSRFPFRENMAQRMRLAAAISAAFQ